MTIRTRTALFALTALWLFTAVAFGQVDQAKEAIDKGDFVRAVNILTEIIATSPSADAYLYLGIAYGNMKEYPKAEDALKEGATHFPQDSRFHNELAGVYLATREVDKAKSELHRALEVDPHNDYASDLLASIDISQGEIQGALRSWNKGGRPVIGEVLHNYYLNFGSWAVRDSVAFHSGDVLRYAQWKTTEARIFATRNFTNVGLEVEPTTTPDRYDAIVRTTSKTNLPTDFLWNAVKGAPYDTSYLDYWNIANSGVNWSSFYRWDVDRRRIEGKLYIPIDIPGVLHVELKDIVRSERWDLSHSVRSQYVDQAHRADFRSNGVQLSLRHIPHYRFEIGGGFAYVNRYAKGDLPQLATNSLNIATFSAETVFRFADGVYQNRLVLNGFASRKSILGDFNVSGGTAEFNNRYTISKDTRTYFDWTIKGGTSSGARPGEDYFVLGLDTHPQNLLRGHKASKGGRYGSAPAGTDFVLGNFDVDRRIVTLPMFNTFNVPYIVIKGEVFVDMAKSWDSTHIFNNTKFLVDTGAGLRFETPTSSFNIVYGRSLRDGQSVLTGYIEHRLW